MQVLVGDIGGTKTRLALASWAGDRVELSAARRYASPESPSLAAIVSRYLDETGITCDLASLAVAGPVRGDHCKTTNLPWELDARELERALGLPRVRLLNDLEAVAWAVPKLESADLVSLHEGYEGHEGDGQAGNGVDARGNACVIAAGTGLGVAGIVWDGARHHPFASEAGHADFAPTNEQEFALLRRLQRRYSHVSWERVCSGQGISAIYEFLLGWHGASTPQWLRQAFAENDDAAAIAESAAAQTCEICIETMDLFASFYARVVGNLALSHMALGGVYLTGGVTLNNCALVRGPAFLATMFNKGRMTPLLRRMPVRIIVKPNVALFGAAHYVSNFKPGYARGIR